MTTEQLTTSQLKEVRQELLNILINASDQQLETMLGAVYERAIKNVVNKPYQFYQARNL
jgi:hypothetical protein